jgi:hypothetical protein
VVELLRNSVAESWEGRGKEVGQVRKTERREWQRHVSMCSGKVSIWNLRTIILSTQTDRMLMLKVYVIKCISM